MYNTFACVSQACPVLCGSRLTPLPVIAPTTAGGTPCYIQLFSHSIVYHIKRMISIAIFPEIGIFIKNYLQYHVDTVFILFVLLP